jgi:alkylation response protein AidB-like acyl-CoA dehydrogenase
MSLFSLPEESLQIRDLARDYARTAILPGAPERDKSHQFPAELVKELGDMGFMGMFIPEKYGGAGMGILDYVLALEEICYADAGVGVIMSVNNSLASWPILTHGTEEQKQKYLPLLASGEKLGCYALTEPNAGSDAGAQKTKVTVSPSGDYVLNGTKMWITNGPQADICVCYGSMDPSERHRAVTAFILEKEFEGAEREGFKIAMSTLDGGRIGIAAQSLGIAQRAFDLAVAYAKERETFGKPIAKQQAIQWMIADMGTRIEAARLLTWRAASLKDQGVRASKECSMAKLYASETANFCADKALQIHGGYGYSKEYEVERLYRDARITTIYEGTSEIQRIVIAKSFLG